MLVACTLSLSTLPSSPYHCLINFLKEKLLTVFTSVSTSKIPPKRRIATRNLTARTPTTVYYAHLSHFSAAVETAGAGLLMRIGVV